MGFLFLAKNNNQISLQDQHREVQAKAEGFDKIRSDLEQNLRDVKERYSESQARSSKTEEKLMAELKEQQDRLSAMTAELTSLRHQSMWADREGKIKMESVQREAEVLRAALAKKEEMVVVAEGKVEELQSNLQALKEESLSVVNELREELRKKDSFYSEQKTGQDSQIDELHKQTNELTREYDRARTDLREKQLEFESMKRELRGGSLA